MSEEQKRDVKLSPAGLTPAEHISTVYATTSEYGVTKEDILTPSYWAHVAQKLRARDVIRVLAEDGSFYMELLVTAADKTWAKVVALNYIDFNKSGKLTDEQVATVGNDYDVRFVPTKKWCVIRKSDRAMVVESLHSKDDAKNWLSIHLKAQGIAA